MKNKKNSILVIIMTLIIGFGGFYLLTKKPSSIKFLIKTNHLNFNEYYIEVYNSDNNQYEIYSEKFKKLQVFQEKSVLNSSEFYQNAENVFYTNKKISLNNNFYNHNNKYYYVNSTRLYNSNNELYISNNELIYNNKTNKNIKVSNNYQLVVMNNKLKAIMDSNKFYLVDNDFKTLNIDGKLLSDIKLPFCEYTSNEVNYYNEKFISVKNKNSISVINIENGNSATYNYEDIIISSDQKYYIVKKNNLYGIIDSSNSFKYPLTYTNIEYDGKYYYLYNNDIITILDKDLNVVLINVKVNLSKNMNCYNGSKYEILINDKVTYFMYYDDLYVYMNKQLTLYNNSYVNDDFVVLNINNSYKVYNLNMTEYPNFEIINNNYSDAIATHLDINVNNVNDDYLDIVLTYSFNEENLREYYSYDLINKKMLSQQYEFFGYEKYYDKFYLKEVNNIYYLYDLNMKSLYNQSTIFDINKIFSNIYYIYDIKNESYQIFEYNN